MGSLIFPRICRKVTVSLFSPSSRLTNLSERRLQTFEVLGPEVVFAKHAGVQPGRMQEISGNASRTCRKPWTMKKPKVIFCSRGGYGAVHLIGKLDFTKVRQHPKWLIGLSDITALHNLFQQNGFASLHAPMARHLTVEPEDDFCTQALEGYTIRVGIGRNRSIQLCCPGQTKS